MKVGDLVKRKGKDWYALVVGFRDEENRFPEIMWLEAGEHNWLGQPDHCSATLLEVVSTVPDHVAEKRATLNP